jgi:hypothetical protein
MELVAAGAKHLAAIGIRARADFEECVAAVFVVLDRKALEKRVASGTGGGSELRCHESIIAILRKIVKYIFPNLPAHVSFKRMAKRKNAAAVELANLRAKSLTKQERVDIASKAGKARMTKLTPEQRSEIARKAGKAGGRGRKKAELSGPTVPPAGR